jgi:hypothetical protein
MATRSTIGMVLEDGQTIRSVYCHWDGYPEGVGATLKEYYTDSTTIENLLDLGDLSVLSENIGQKQDFDNRTEGSCLFYGRDRGETGINALTHADENEWIGFRKGNGCEYGYLWNGVSWSTFKI